MCALRRLAPDLRRYIVKQLSKSERQSFLEFAPDYFRYMATMLHKGRDTCLAKILGVYQVRQDLSLCTLRCAFTGRDSRVLFRRPADCVLGCSSCLVPAGDRLVRARVELRADDCALHAMGADFFSSPGHVPPRLTLNTSPALTL